MQRIPLVLGRRSILPVAVGLVTIAMVISTAGLVMAQGGTDEGEISVIVHPAESAVTPEIDLPQAGSATLASREGASATQPSSMIIAGTLTGFVVLPGSASFDVPVTTTLHVRDDRGTSVGWSVVLSSTSRGAGTGSSNLIANPRESVIRILPRHVPDQRAGTTVTTGGMLGSLGNSLVVLQASPGSGSGVHTQNLTIEFPAVEDGDMSTLVVQLTSAP